MTHLEQTHYDAINNSKEIALYEESYIVVPKEAAKKCAQLTEDIAIEFSEWRRLYKKKIQKELFEMDYGPERKEKYVQMFELLKDGKRLFQEFLKTKQ